MSKTVVSAPSSGTVSRPVSEASTQPSTEGSKTSKGTPKKKKARKRETTISVDIDVAVKIRPISEPDDLIKPPDDVRETFTLYKLLVMIPYLIFPWMLDVPYEEEKSESESDTDLEDEEKPTTCFNLSFKVLWSDYEKYIKLHNVVEKRNELPYDWTKYNQYINPDQVENVETFSVQIKDDQNMPKQEITLTFVIKTHALSRNPVKSPKPPPQPDPKKEDREEVNIEATIVNHMVKNLVKHEMEVIEDEMTITEAAPSASTSKSIIKDSTKESNKSLQSNVSLEPEPTDKKSLKKVQLSKTKFSSEPSEDASSKTPKRSGKL